MYPSMIVQRVYATLSLNNNNKTPLCFIGLIFGCQLQYIGAVIQVTGNSRRMIVLLVSILSIITGLAQGRAALYNNTLQYIIYNAKGHLQIIIANIQYKM